MSSDQISFIVEYDFFKKLCAVPEVKSIFLYGSRARGDATKFSDIDLAIDLDGSKNKNNWENIMDIIDNADTLLAIDCVRFDTLSNPELKQEIELNKVILFKRD